MQVRDPINTPSLSGWVFASGLGALGAAVSWLLLGIGANGSVMIGAIVALVVGVIVGLPTTAVPQGSVTAAASSAPPAASPVSPPPVSVAPVTPVASAPAARLAPAKASDAGTPPAAGASEPPVALAAATTPLAAAVAAPIIDPVPAESVAPAPAADKPRTLDAARNGRPDDLKLIRGVGPKMEAMLHRMGFFHFDQVAAWTPAELAWVDDNLEGFKGRASRDEWVSQARILAGGGTTEFSTRNV